MILKISCVYIYPIAVFGRMIMFLLFFDLGGPAQQTRNICITFVQCWTNVEDVGPTLYKCFVFAG